MGSYGDVAARPRRATIGRYEVGELLYNELWKQFWFLQFQGSKLPMTKTKMFQSSNIHMLTVALSQSIIYLRYYCY